MLLISAACWIAGQILYYHWSVVTLTGSCVFVRISSRHLFYHEIFPTEVSGNPVRTELNLVFILVQREM